MRTRTLASGLFLLVAPALVIYFVYYDSIANRSTIPRYSEQSIVLDSSHKYAGIWQQQFNQSRRGAVRALMQPQSMPSPESSRDRDPEIERRRQLVKEMMKEAWDNYARYAWGYNELKPLTREAKQDSIFGSAKIGLTIVDSMDTLWIMDMRNEFLQARQWLASSFEFKNVSNEVSVFETIIRYVGGLLSCYALTGDELFLNKSLEVAKALLPVYNTDTGLPNGLIVPSTGKNYHHTWAFGSILSEMGSQHLEYVYLSDMTGDNRFRDNVLKIRNVLDKAEKPNGLYMTMMDNVLGRWSENKSTLGALADSFYEYLIKAYIQSKHRDHVAIRMYKDAIDAVEHNNLIQVSRTGLYYLADWIFGKPNNKMQHLTCFAGGMFGLGAAHMAADVSNANNEVNHTEKVLDIDRVARHHAIAVNITETCYQSYNRTPTKLGPETFYFDSEDDATNRNGDIYILRPEVIESYFVMWRLTHDNRYREYAWEATQALYRHCRTGTGYSGLYNVMQLPPTMDNTQQSFFLAETLKYLYLIFSDDSLIPLDQWVFNTEAHPLPICGNNTAYPAELCTDIFQ